LQNIVKKADRSHKIITAIIIVMTLHNQALSAVLPELRLASSFLRAEAVSILMKNDQDPDIGIGH
jgi:hypothetical protein